MSWQLLFVVVVTKKNTNVGFKVINTVNKLCTDWQYIEQIPHDGHIYY